MSRDRQTDWEYGNFKLFAVGSYFQGSNTAARSRLTQI